MESLRSESLSALHHDAVDFSAGESVAIGHLARALLRKEVERRLNPEQSDRKNAQSGDTRLVAALQALLARDFALADGWQDLDARLEQHGYELGITGGAMMLSTRGAGLVVCTVEELGPCYHAMARRFCAQMSGSVAENPHGMVIDEPDSSTESDSP